MFDIGLGELLVVLILATVLLGPEKCLKFARELGAWIRKIEARWNETRESFK